MPWFGFCQERSWPVSNLQAVVLEHDTVLLTWDFPDGFNASPMELSWIKADTINDMVQYGYDSYGGSLFDELDLRQFIGWKIQSMSFFKLSNWTHYVCVMAQKKGDAMQELCCQQVPDELPLGLNTIMLEEPLSIEQETCYWLALRIKHEANQDGYIFVFGTVDHGQGLLGKSDLWMDSYQNGWWEYPLAHCWIKANLVNDHEKGDASQDGEDKTLTGYRIYRNGELIEEIPYRFVTYFKDNEFTKGIDVEYCVTVVYDDGESEPLCVMAVITDLDETTGDDVINVSPNPTDGLVHVKGKSISEISVYNVMGQLMKMAQNTNEIDLKDMSCGLYSLRITSANGTVTTKMVIKE